MKNENPLKDLEKLNADRFNFDLTNIKSAIKRLRITPKAKIIHITGTNGKGSTSQFVASVLAESGYAAGLYTSPHLSDIRERIKILRPLFPAENSTGRRRFMVESKISENNFIRHITRIRKTVERKPELELTYFEFLTLVCFSYFSELDLDFWVLEVGLGGRLDATNVFNRTEVSVITNISKEHCNYLGNTLEQITYEKSGIIKKKSLLITGVRERKLLGILGNKCKGLKTDIKIFNKDFKVENINCDERGKFSFDYRGKKIIQNISSPFYGSFQVANAALAISVAENLSNNFLNITENVIKKGIEKAEIRGRNEIIRLGNKKIILNSAHNPAAFYSLIKHLKEFYNINNVVLVFGLLSDKDAEQIVRVLPDKFKSIIITEPDSKRRMPSEILKKIFEINSKECRVIKNSVLAYEIGLQGLERRDLLLICGSFYLTGGFIKHYGISRN